MRQTPIATLLFTLPLSEETSTQIEHILRTQGYVPHFYHLTGKEHPVPQNPVFAQAVHNMLIKKNYTLSLAESCTGGALASAFTANPGSSQYFLGSFVTYSDNLKKNLLGVSKESLEKEGAVSEEVVKQMVKGALEKSESDFSLATSGIAGPEGGSVEKPVGTVWVALAKKEGPIETKLLHLQGNRQEIIQETINHLLKTLLMAIS